MAEEDPLAFSMHGVGAACIFVGRTQWHGRCHGILGPAVASVEAGVTASAYGRSMFQALAQEEAPDAGESRMGCSVANCMADAALSWVAWRCVADDWGSHAPRGEYAGFAQDADIYFPAGQSVPIANV